MAASFGKNKNPFGPRVFKNESGFMLTVDGDDPDCPGPQFLECVKGLNQLELIFHVYGDTVPFLDAELMQAARKPIHHVI